MIPDLAAARATAATAFDSTCTITRDDEGPGDDYWDPDAGRMVRADDDSSTVYTGPCMVRPAADRRGAAMEAGASQYEQLYRVRVPVANDVVKVGDVVTVTAEPNDPAMVGTALTVTRVEGGTRAVTRILLCTIERRGPDL